MANDTWAVLPVKPFGEAKSRLHGVLDAAKRRHLARELMLRSLDALLACAPARRVLVISTDAEALALAAARGAGALIESGTDLNQALAQARSHVLAQGGAGLLVLAADLPLVTAEEIEAVLASDDDATVVIAPDRRSSGTNALLLRPPDVIDFDFEGDSAHSHRDLALAAGIEPLLLSLPGLAFDLDLPEDWHDLLRHGWSPGQSLTGESPLA